MRADGALEVGEWTDYDDTDPRCALGSQIREAGMGIRSVNYDLIGIWSINDQHMLGMKIEVFNDVQVSVVDVCCSGDVRTIALQHH